MLWALFGEVSVPRSRFETFDIEPYITVREHLSLNVMRSGYAQAQFSREIIHRHFLDLTLVYTVPFTADN